MKEKKNVKRVMSVPEIVWTVVEGLFGLAGITLIVLGFVADYLPLLYSENYLLQAQQDFMNATHTPLTFRWLGFICLLIGAVLALITLHFFAKRRDVSDERELRRQQRMKIIAESAPEPEVVDAESKPVESKPQVNE